MQLRARFHDAGTSFLGPAWGENTRHRIQCRQIPKLLGRLDARLLDGVLQCGRHRNLGSSTGRLQHLVVKLDGA